MTENDRKTLKFLADSQGEEFLYSQIGFALYPDNKPGRTAGRWPQGLALAGGKAVSRLIKAKLVVVCPGNDHGRKFRLTEIGRAAL